MTKITPEEIAAARAKLDSAREAIRSHDRIAQSGREEGFNMAADEEISEEYKRALLTEYDLSVAFGETPRISSQRAEQLREELNS